MVRNLILKLLIFSLALSLIQQHIISKGAGPWCRFREIGIWYCTFGLLLRRKWVQHVYAPGIQLHSKQVNCIKCMRQLLSPLHRNSSTEAHTLFPWVLKTCNNLQYKHQLSPIKIPDVNPSELPQYGLFSMSAGDFLQVYKEKGSQVVSVCELISLSLRSMGLHCLLFLHWYSSQCNRIYWEYLQYIEAWWCLDQLW